MEKRVRKQEHIFKPKKPRVKDITNWLGLGNDYSYLAKDSSISFMDFYVR